MNNTATELKTLLNKQGWVETNDHSSQDCSSVESIVHPYPGQTTCWVWPTSNVSLPGVFSHPYQHTFQPGMVDPLSLSSVPAPPDRSHDSSVSAPWFTNEPSLCSVMPEGLHALVAGITVPQPMDHEQIQEGLTEVTSHIIEPIVCNISGEGQILLISPCEPGHVFLNLESAPAHRYDCPVKDVNVFRIPSQHPQYQQTACIIYASKDQRANMKPQAPHGRAAETIFESRSRKPCHCIRSQCLKLYCECFANGVMCSNCNCSNCHNNGKHEMRRRKAIKSCLGRNPDAFRPKIAGEKLGEVKGWHNKGCNCKRSGCLKNYCKCYEANIVCSSNCKCVGCRNYDTRSEKGPREKTGKDKWMVSLITPTVLKAVCGCLMAKVKEAERKGQSKAQAEHMVLDEFGHCLTRIVKAIFKYNTD